MIKWFAYIVMLLVVAPALSSAKEKGYHNTLFNTAETLVQKVSDTTTAAAAKNAKHQQDQDDKKRIKEVAKARRQPKPEKIIPVDAPEVKKQKPKRQRRPEGLERPPEIPRRNGD